jgi:hypothetical protein
VSLSAALAALDLLDSARVTGQAAVTAVATALALARTRRAGDPLPGDVVITTHIGPHAPVQPHEPVPFMGNPVDQAALNREDVLPEMDAILSVDTTRGNRVVNRRGFAISPTVRAGWILRVSDDLLEVAKAFGGGRCRFHDPDEWSRIPARPHDPSPGTVKP